ncbi:fatty acid desaturase [Amycolatopsis cynarae]|uniref:Fatty acid desaturase n=1 Tax=Amycolatopsis cynarae TaxID=2995223 RepID=A0ABY7AUD8_9PSEU|nr:fatty acid desaturase [Amycolatopsis sp. HUAS 11-8]WAL63565.1 fatty acid desaturase [Amycolatopsis sp. HUAS 11-8]
MGVPVLSEPESLAVRRGVPDPGVALPRVSLPTTALFGASLTGWAVATWLVLGTSAAPWLTIPLHTLVTFTMFTVLHEASHHAAGRARHVNSVLGRLAMPFVACYAGFGMIRYLHLEHHRNTNEALDADPDAWTSHGPWWQWPLRWLTIDFWYARFYLRRARRRPPAEVAEAFSALVLTTVGVTFAIATGHLWQLAVIYLIPQRLGLGVLAWWFDWLPHHGLPETAAQNRFRATRMRVGLEWLLTPVLLYQNYHLVHHLHPAIPFYRYLQAWRRNEEAYLDREVPISTAWGRELTPSEYRAWRRITGSYQPGATGDRMTFHELKVAEVRPLTADSVSIGFTVPAELAAHFRFTPGQHVTVRKVLDGREIRRTYSLCTAATSEVVRIAVKRVPGGVMSDFLTTGLRAGDRLEVLPPAGRFTLEGAPGRHYGAIAAGSGITPVISMLSTVLTVHGTARFTLLYGNRSAETTMFSDELSMLARRFEGRLRILHFRSEPGGETSTGTGFEEYMPGRIDSARLSTLVSDRLSDVDSWYLCGPQELVENAREVLRGKQHTSIHFELFHATARPPIAATATPCMITATVRGTLATASGTGAESVLESLLRADVDVPYGCLGGACGTCRAKLLQGRGEHEQNHALSEEDLADGYVLTCQLRPASARLDLDYDA